MINVEKYREYAEAQRHGAPRQAESEQALGCLHQRRFFRAGHPAIPLRDHTYSCFLSC